MQCFGYWQTITFLSGCSEIISKHLHVHTFGANRTTLIFIWSCVCVQLMNKSLIFIYFVLALFLVTTCSWGKSVSLAAKCCTMLTCCSPTVCVCAVCCESSDTEPKDSSTMSLLCRLITTYDPYYIVIWYFIIKILIIDTLNAEPVQ